MIPDHLRCRWIDGDPREVIRKDVFCPKERVLGLLYCEEHAKRAYSKGEPVETIMARVAG